MNPDSPHVVDHEFLTFQYWSVTPTNSTPWLRLVLQLLKTPLLYGDQLVASTATDRGLPVRAVARLAQPETSVKPEILKAPELVTQFPLTALQGQAASVVIPCSFTNLKARSMRPPLQALFPQLAEQSTNCCSEKDWRFPNPSLESPSRAPVAEKAQQDPHCPWFLTAVTAPLETQSTSPTEIMVSSTATLEVGTMVPRQVSANSSSVRWENWLIPMSKDLALLALWASILAMFSAQTLSLYFSSKVESKKTPKDLLNSLKFMEQGLTSWLTITRARRLVRASARARLSVLAI